MKNKRWADHVLRAKIVKSVQRNMRKEYDFSKGVRGKYAKRYKTGTNIVLLDPGVAKVFKTPRSVNQALRSLAEIIKAQKQKA